MKRREFLIYDLGFRISGFMIYLAKRGRIRTGEPYEDPARSLCCAIILELLMALLALSLLLKARTKRTVRLPKRIR